MIFGWVVRIPAPDPVEVFQHIRVVVGIVLGLGITRLLNGVARIVQHPNERRVYAVHLGWVATLLLTLVHFWWWQFGLSRIAQWTFEIYLFVIVYAITLFLVVAILVPDKLDDYASYADYFLSRRRWFFGLYALTIVLDVADTRIKGAAHFSKFATEYLFRVPIYLGLCGVAAWTASRRFQAVFVVLALVNEVFWIVRLFNTPG